MSHLNTKECRHRLGYKRCIASCAIEAYDMTVILACNQLQGECMLSMSKSKQSITFVISARVRQGLLMYFDDNLALRVFQIK